ncbi:hypothetical protein B0H63DRAFT_555011 [Podospora didyma]|uniref:Uncharacterized protein n=1 Tax=Podospora didyma TaxID=330526 RepID=A0AAE0U7B7_9PEZI|nr:hypothetical protein B0H63DRAFT_555011 [Podospora didyma]
MSSWLSPPPSPRSSRPARTADPWAFEYRTPRRPPPPPPREEVAGSAPQREDARRKFSYRTLDGQFFVPVAADNSPSPSERLEEIPPEKNDDTFETIDLEPDLEKQEPQPDPNAPKKRRHRARKYFSSAAWWQDEYWMLGVCVATAACLAVLLRQYDNRVVPEDLGFGLQVDTAIIALVTIVRVSLKAFVETALAQGAWIWVSEMAQRRCKHNARLSDFKVFDEASRGMWGSLCLIWRMKFRHLGCIGAAIIILIHGFETFSQQMVIFEQRPTPFLNSSYNPAPAPARSEVWDTYLLRGFAGDLVPALSTKAAVYSGIISTEIPMLTAPCETANCSWPLIPTLAACGGCTEIPISSKCNQTARTCTFSTSSGVAIENPVDSTEHSSFKVSPSNGSVHPMSSTNRAYFSVFDMLSLTQASSKEITVSGNECALWFCIQSYSISIKEGTQIEELAGNWSNVALNQGSGSRNSEYVFVDIPDELNVDNSTRYSVSYEAMTALRSFMTTITQGTVGTDFSSIDYSSDWVEAMWNATGGSLPDWINSFARSMTAEIRQNGKLVPASISPKAKGMYWMLYPGLMILLSIYFLFHTIWASARDDVSAWKGGALPMLFCRVDDNIHDHVGDGMDVPNGLEERVGDIRVAMYRAENGQWGFRSTGYA